MIFDYVIGVIYKLMTLMNCINFSDFSIIDVARQAVSNKQLYREEIIKNSIAEEIILNNPAERQLDNTREGTSQSSAESGY